LIEAARQSGFAFNDTKSQRPSSEITAFNVALSNGTLAITEGRMREFEDDILRSPPAAVAAIIAYVRSINRSQADGLAELAIVSPASG
jgi:hypothetical protein